MVRSLVSFRRNDRGDIPVTILVIGVFAICALAIISFILSDVVKFDTKKNLGIDLAEEVHIDIEKYDFYTSSKIGNTPELARDKIAAKWACYEKEDCKWVIKKTNDVVTITYEIP